MSAALRRYLLLPALLALAGCAGGEVPRVQPVSLASVEEAHGRQVFMTYCHQCHPNGEAGLGPALNDLPVPGFLIKLQVRNGYGAMPGFDGRQISSQELDHLVAYLVALRRQS